MTWLILEGLLALGIIVGIMVWTLKTRTDTPLPDDTSNSPSDGDKAGNHADSSSGPKGGER